MCVSCNKNRIECNKRKAVWNGWYGPSATLLPALSCLFYMRTSSLWWRFLKWNVRGFVFSRILLRSHCLVVYFVHVVCCVFAYVYLRFSCWCCCWFSYNKFDVCICVAFGLLFSCEMILGRLHLRNNILV